MSKRGIIFDTVSIAAILADAKSQSRRVIKPQPKLAIPAVFDVVHTGGRKWQWEDNFGNVLPNYPVRTCPWEKGDVLWVREALQRSGSGIVVYAADGTPVMQEGESVTWPWKRDTLPAKFMPRWAVRIFLTVISIRVEQVQDISVDDVYAEGCPVPSSDEVGSEIYEWLAGRWDSLNAIRGYDWESNPWVFAIEFEREKP